MPPAGEIEVHLRGPQAHGAVVQHVDVGLVTRRQEATVVQADGLGRRPRLLVDQRLQRDPAGRPVPAPPLEQGGGEADVADRADVGAAIGEAGHGGGVDDLLPDGVEVASPVVQDRHVEKAGAVAPGEDVVGQLGRVPSLPLGSGLDRGARIGLVVGWVAELEHELEPAGQTGSQHRGVTVDPELIEDPSLHLGLGHRRHPLGVGQRGQLPVELGTHERAERGLMAEEQADGPGPDLAPHRHPGSGGGCAPVEQFPATGRGWSCSGRSTSTGVGPTRPPSGGTGRTRRRGR